MPRPEARPLVFLCLLAAGCAFARSSENEPLDPLVLEQLVPGKTTAREVTALLGGPAEVVQIGNRSAYQYVHVMTKGAGLLLPPFILGNADTRADRIWVWFDENDVLTHVGATFAGHRPLDWGFDVSYGLENYTSVGVEYDSLAVAAEGLVLRFDERYTLVDIRRGFLREFLPSSAGSSGAGRAVSSAF